MHRFGFPLQTSPATLKGAPSVQSEHLSEYESPAEVLGSMLGPTWKFNLSSMEGIQKS